MIMALWRYALWPYKAGRSPNRSPIADQRHSSSCIGTHRYICSGYQFNACRLGRLASLRIAYRGHYQSPISIHSLSNL